VASSITDSDSRKRRREGNHQSRDRVREHPILCGRQYAGGRAYAARFALSPATYYIISATSSCPESRARRSCSDRGLQFGRYIDRENVFAGAHRLHHPGVLAENAGRRDPKTESRNKKTFETRPYILSYRQYSQLNGSNFWDAPNM